MPAMSESPQETGLLTVAVVASTMGITTVEITCHKACNYFALARQIFPCFVRDGSRNRTLIGWEIATFPPPASALRIRHRLPPIVRRPMLPSPPPSSLAVLGPPFLLRSLLRLRRRRGVIVGAVWDQPIVVGAVEEVARCRLGRRGPARLRRGRQVSFLYFSFSFSFIFTNNDFNLH